MRQEKMNHISVVVDGYTRILLTVIAVLLVLVAVGMWCESPQLVPSAEARIPDSGLQLQQIQQGLDRINQTLDQISQTMVSGNMKVRLVDPQGVPLTAGKAATLVRPAAPPAR